MLKKIAVLAFAVAAALPAAPAGAWEQVCMKLPLWKAWISGNFHVVYDFSTHLGKLPLSYQEPGASRMSIPGELRGDTRVPPARGHVGSSTIHVNQTRCANISEIPQGKPFFIYFSPHLGTPALCETHSSNPDKWYHQTNRPYRTLNYESTGTTLHTKCRFTHES